MIKPADLLNDPLDVYRNVYRPVCGCEMSVNGEVPRKCEYHRRRER